MWPSLVACSAHYCFVCKSTGIHRQVWRRTTHTALPALDAPLHDVCLTHAPDLLLSVHYSFVKA